MDNRLKKFWEWMLENRKNFLYYADAPTTDLSDEKNTPKQILVGYLIEYLLLTGKISFVRFGGWLKEMVKERRFKTKGVVLNGHNYIDVIYDILANKIMETDNEKEN